jgi:hypothetical protein
LKGVFGVVVISQYAATDVPDHGTMPVHEGRESGFVPLLDERRQEPPIAVPRSILQAHAGAKALYQFAQRIGRHLFPGVVRYCRLHTYYQKRRNLMHDFVSSLAFS